MANPTTFTVVDSVTDTTISAHAQITNTSGQAITSVEYAFSPSATTPIGLTIYQANASTGAFVISGLTPGVGYNVWTRANIAGYTGVWSTRNRGITWYFGAHLLNSVFHADSGGQNVYNWKRSVVYVKSGGTWHVVQPWVKIAGVWKVAG